MRSQLALALLLAGCLDHGDDTQAVQSSIEKSNGGLTTDDEAPMFAAEAEFDDAAIEADTQVSDTMAADPTVVDMQNSTTAAARDLIVIWGRIPADPTALTPRDWTGALTLSRGALLVHRTIAFEDLTDRLLPRESRDTVAFRSVTRPFVDGLALRAIDPTPAATDPLTLTYTPANASPAITLDLSQLANGPIVVDAGDGNKIVAVGERRDDACAGGFMRGRWHALTANLGVFHGIVASRDGTPIGHVRGIYGHRRNGDAVAFGKFIDRDGKFVGLLVGTYGDGEFKARWIDRAGDHGAIHGRYFESTAVRGGGFVARWAETSCSEDH